MAARRSHMIAGILIIVVCLIVFVALTVAVTSGSALVQFDAALAEALHPQITPAAVDFYRVVTLLGNQGMWALGIAGGLFLLLQRRWAYFVIWVIGMLGGNLFNNLLKDTFDRARPVFDNPYSFEPSFGFPSGHAMMSLIGFGLLTYLMWERLPTRPLRWIALGVAVMLVLIIGISRLTLGVHYLSDVLAGYAMGAAWLTGCLLALNAIKRREPAA